jgi:hypothetical protein
MANPDLFDGLRPPEPPGALRRRVLGTSSRRVVPTGPSTWQRLWEQPGLRLAWAMAVLVLLAGHALLSLPEPGPSPSPAPRIRVASATLDPSISTLVDIDRIDGRNLPNL